MAEFFPFVDVGDVNLDFGDFYGCQGVPEGVAVVGEGAGVDDDSFGVVVVGFLDFVDEGAFVVALEYVQMVAFFLGFLLQKGGEGFIILGSVDSFFADSQEV